MRVIVVLVLVLTTVTLCCGEFQKPRCGDCWCIWYGEEDTCPDSTGISDTFPESYAVYDTLELMNPTASYLQLRTADGEECYPFANTLVQVEGYAKSTLPQCAIPGVNDTSTPDAAVCAYKFEQGVECSGRNYEILNYESTQAAEEDGAVVTHTGGTIPFLFARGDCDMVSQVTFVASTHFHTRFLTYMISSFLFFSNISNAFS